MGAIPIHHTATVEGEWDGPAAVAAMPNEYAVLHYCHAWQSAEADASSHTPGDDDEDDKKSAFAMPHHKTKGGPANLNGVRNALARLENSNIPESDKAGVKAHLQAHLDDAHDDSSNRIPTLAGIANYGAMTTADRIRAQMPRVQRLSNRTDWFRITDHMDGQPARVDIFDEIGFWGVTAGDFNAQLNAIAADRIEVHVNSPGGDVFDGIAILNLLRAHPAPVDVVVDGLAASAASFIAMAGDTVTMMPNSQLMIHDASGLCIGNQQDMADMSNLLNLMSDNIANVYATRTGTTADQWRDAMKAETWYSAEEAVEAGLADAVGEIRGGKKPTQATAPAAATEPTTSADNVWNLSFYTYANRAAAPAPPMMRSAATDTAAPHEPTIGAHGHPHNAYGDQGGDPTDEHEHSHDSDADHDHQHGGDHDDDTGSVSDQLDPAPAPAESPTQSPQPEITFRWDPEQFREAMKGAHK